MGEDRDVCSDNSTVVFLYALKSLLTIHEQDLLSCNCIFATLLRSLHKCCIKDWKSQPVQVSLLLALPPAKQVGESLLLLCAGREIYLKGNNNSNHFALKKKVTSLGDLDHGNVSVSRPHQLSFFGGPNAGFIVRGCGFSRYCPKIWRLQGIEDFLWLSRCFASSGLPESDELEKIGKRRKWRCDILTLFEMQPSN